MNTSYVLITGANSLASKSLALDLAKSGQNLLLIGKPNDGLALWVAELTRYGVEVDFFELEHYDHPNMHLLADWIHRSYSISCFLNFDEIAWMEELFDVTPDKKFA